MAQRTDLRWLPDSGCKGVWWQEGGLIWGQTVGQLGAVKGLRQRKDLIKSVSSMTEKNATVERLTQCQACSIP